MAKELMEIGGFITEGAEIVNHDASLSGNGTVDSPLGLNETLLYSATGAAYDNARKSIALSESCRNFDRIRVMITNNDYATQAIEFDPAVTTGTMTFQGNTISNEPQLYVKMTTWVIGDTTFTFRHGAQYRISNGSTSVVGSVVSTAANYVVPYKVIGINRIANN